MDLNPRNAAKFRRRLLKWAPAHVRRFPWRSTTSRYRLLLSELMLRRTQANQVVPIYEKMIRDYPTLADFCAASGEDLRSILKPLGLSWRIEDIIKVSIELSTLQTIPASPESLRRLTGVGDYVSSAVTSFSGSAALAVIDTNVVRVLGRVFGIRLEGETRRRKEMRDAATLCLSKRSHRSYNYAILDFAAIVCTLKKPACGSCPFRDCCSDANSSKPLH